ncbi:hypothetical protein LIA77_02551 [Sarocladium implicatum]|nr:hypothetical protein LIA77_02551 [Sarocladium implicatum]
MRSHKQSGRSSSLLLPDMAMRLVNIVSPSPTCQINVVSSVEIRWGWTLLLSLFSCQFRLSRPPLPPAATLSAAGLGIGRATRKPSRWFKPKVRRRWALGAACQHAKRHLPSGPFLSQQGFLMDCKVFIDESRCNDRAASRTCFATREKRYAISRAERESLGLDTTTISFSHFSFLLHTTITIASLASLGAEP